MYQGHLSNEMLLSGDQRGMPVGTCTLLGDDATEAAPCEGEGHARGDRVVAVLKVLCDKGLCLSSLAHGYVAPKLGPDVADLSSDFLSREICTPLMLVAVA